MVSHRSIPRTRELGTLGELRVLGALGKRLIPGFITGKFAFFFANYLKIREMML